MFEVDSRRFTLGFQPEADLRADESTGRPRERQPAGGWHSKTSQWTISPSKFAFGFGGTWNMKRCPTRGSKLFGNIHSASVSLSAMPSQTCSLGCESNISLDCFGHFLLFFDSVFEAARGGHPKTARNVRSTRTPCRAARVQVVAALAAVPLLGYETDMSEIRRCCETAGRLISKCAAIVPAERSP